MVRMRSGSMTIEPGTLYGIVRLNELEAGRGGP